MNRNILSENLLSKISYLDAFSGCNGILSIKGREMVSNPTDETIKACITAITDIKTQIESKPDSKLILKSVYEALLPFLGKVKIGELINNDNEIDISQESFQDLIIKLDTLVGLEKVKNTIHDLLSYFRVQNLRKKEGLQSPNRTLHLAFLGNPGTGKTTVARIIGKMYKHLGLLSKGHFTEVSRTDLIAGYQGQTALKVKKVIEKAKGGVLFIDEAYSLTENDHSDSYGRECLTELTKALEDYRKDLVVIVAGYTQLMRNFFDSNPGLKSRFNTFIEFPDYDTKEMIEIFQQMATQDDYILTDYAIKKLEDIIKKTIDQKPENFANGRFIRNLYEDVIMNHAKRIDLIKNPGLEELKTIELEDFSSLS